ncbi:class I SAM-dependent methyltransferase [Candidatus Neomarinimicrobiota bacterium]
MALKKIRKLLLMDEHVCPWWFAYSFDNPLRRLIQPAGKIVAPHVQPGMTVLDIGCGMGYFSLELARRIGPEGRVIAVDLQEKMLQGLRKRAERHGLMDRITLHRCEPDSLGVSQEADFILTFWMVHEVPDQRSFLEELHAVLKPDGKWLLAEPKLLHTSQPQFDALLDNANAVGFHQIGRPEVRFSYAALLEKNP